MCDTKLNFFESKDPTVIGSLLMIDIETNDLSESLITIDTKITDEYMWVEGRKNSLGTIKAHGGFVKLIGNGKGIKSYILPRIRQLSFKKTADEKILKKLNKIDTENVEIKGKNTRIMFSLADENINILQFDLCEEDSDDDEVPELEDLTDSEDEDEEEEGEEGEESEEEGKESNNDKRKLLLDEREKLLKEREEKLSLEKNTLLNSLKTSNITTPFNPDKAINESVNSLNSLSKTEEEKKPTQMTEEQSEAMGETPLEEASADQSTDPAPAPAPEAMSETPLEDPAPVPTPMDLSLIHI